MDRSSRFFFLLLFGTALLFAALRWPMLEVPMERDEGEYATIGLGIYHGIPPYSEAYTMKLPGAASLHAVIFWLFGPTVRSLHLALLLINVLTIGLVGIAGRRLIGSQGGLFAGAAYGTFTIGAGMFGFWLSAEHFAALFLMAGACLMIGRSQKSEVRSQNGQIHEIKKEEKTSTMDSGFWILTSLIFGSFLLGCSIVIKHHAALPALAWLLVPLWKRGVAVCRSPFDKTQPSSFILHPSAPAAGMLLAFFAPVLITMMVMASCGVWEKFRFWTWDYAKQYASAVPLRMGWEYFKIGGGRIFLDAPLLWVLSLFGLGAVIWRPAMISPIGSARAWLLPVALASAAAAGMGLLFRGQYFILLAPAAALLAGTAWETLRWWRPGRRWTCFDSPPLRWLPGAALLVGSFVVLLEPFMIGIYRTPAEVCRRVYGMNPFPEYAAVADHLKRATRPDEKIAVMGSEPALYFLADRRPAIPYLCIYEAMKPHAYAKAMQKEVMDCLEKSRPRALVFVEAPTSWGSTPQSDPTLLQWLKRFIPRHYRLDGVVDLVSESKTVIRWGDAARAYRPESPYRVWVFLRKE